MIEQCPVCEYTAIYPAATRRRYGFTCTPCLEDCGHLTLPTAEEILRDERLAEQERMYGRRLRPGERPGADEMVTRLVIITAPIALVLIGVGVLVWWWL